MGGKEVYRRWKGKKCIENGMGEDKMERAEGIEDGRGSRIQKMERREVH